LLEPYAARRAASVFGVSRNASLAQAIDHLSDHVDLLGILTLKEKSVRALLVVRHESIFKALSTRDGNAVEKAVKAYLSAAHRSVTAALAAVDSRD
jgi:DNA-binding GntR family transcriptional regulator